MRCLFSWHVIASLHLPLAPRCGHRAPSTIIRVNLSIMSRPGRAVLSEDDTRIVADGDWTLEHANHLGAMCASLVARGRAVMPIDASALGRIDTAGASLLLDLAGEDPAMIDGVDAATRKLFTAVARAEAAPPAGKPRRDSGFLATLGNVGAALEAFWHDGVALVGFIGVILSALMRNLLQPRGWRLTSIVAHVEQTGLNALPIVALLCFLVGAVVAFLGATVLREFGASLFTVELVGYSFLREFGVLLTAIMVAGRSGSAFTAQIGSMKAREEIDAIRTLGLQPVDVLVVPRVFALLVSMPILTLAGMLAGLLGGAAVCVMALDISPLMFVTRLHETTAVRHFWVGMSKAPIFAFLIAAIGCLEGFKVAGSAESVGRHTTSSVVQSIFVVILIDALAAIFFMEMDL
jgi:phospholipid/cholesterol/gamma-HCH transport system permease protein